MPGRGSKWRQDELPDSRHELRRGGVRVSPDWLPHERVDEIGGDERFHVVEALADTDES